MSYEFVLKVAEQSVWMILLIAGPIMLIALAIGLIVSIFQATTQIQEQTLAFAPKIIAVLVGMIFLGPWMLSKMVNFSASIFENLYKFIG